MRRGAANQQQGMKLTIAVAAGARPGLISPFCPRRTAVAALIVAESTRGGGRLAGRLVLLGLGSCSQSCRCHNTRGISLVEEATRPQLRLQGFCFAV